MSETTHKSSLVENLLPIICFKNVSHFNFFCCCTVQCVRTIHLDIILSPILVLIALCEFEKKKDQYLAFAHY